MFTEALMYSGSYRTFALNSMIKYLLKDLRINIVRTRSDTRIPDTILVDVSLVVVVYCPIIVTCITHTVRVSIIFLRRISH